MHVSVRLCFRGQNIIIIKYRVVIYLYRSKKGIILTMEHGIFWIAGTILFIDFGSSYMRVHFRFIYYTDIYDLCTFLFESYISHLKAFKMYLGGCWKYGTLNVSLLSFNISYYLIAVYSPESFWWAGKAYRVGVLLKVIGLMKYRSKKKVGGRLSHFMFGKAWNCEGLWNENQLTNDFKKNLTFQKSRQSNRKR